jgi:MFS family permease
MSPQKLSKVEERNFHHLYLDILGWGFVVGSTISFLAVYMAHLGASSHLLGLQLSGPALITILLSMPIAHWMKKRNLIKITFWSSIYYRLSFLIVFLLPKFVDSSLHVTIIIIIAFVATIPITVISISFNAMFADLVAFEHRPFVVGRRNAIFALTATLVTLLSGYILDHMSFLDGYQIVFSFGLIGAIYSSYHLYMLKPMGVIPKRVGKPIRDMGSPGFARGWAVMRKPNGLRFLIRSAANDYLRVDILKSSFGKLMVAHFFFYTSLFYIAPLVPVYFVQQQKISDGTISWGVALFHLAMFFISLNLAKITEVLGIKKSIFLSSFGFSFLPIMIALWQGIPMFVLAHLVGGAMRGWVDGNIINNLMERTPGDDRPAHMALNHMVINFGVLVGSTLGPLIGDLTNVRTAILIGGIMRLFASFIMRLWA